MCPFLFGARLWGQLDTKYLVISVIGPHAGESEDEIFKRKMDDIRKTGKTFWLIKSHKAKPDMVQSLCKEAEMHRGNSLTVFVEASSSTGARPTVTAKEAKEYSQDGVRWKGLPKGLSSVTGKIDNGTYALIFNQLKLVNDVIDLWGYADFLRQDQPIKIFLGASTICAVRKNMSSHPLAPKSHCRKVIAIGKLCEPYCVWLR